MDEALQNILDYMESEVRHLNKRDYQRLLKRLMEDCESQLQASLEFDRADERDEEDDDGDFELPDDYEV